MVNVRVLVQSPYMLCKRSRIGCRVACSSCNELNCVANCSLSLSPLSWKSIFQWFQFFIKTFSKSLSLDKISVTYLSTLIGSIFFDLYLCIIKFVSTMSNDWFDYFRPVNLRIYYNIWCNFKLTQSMSPLLWKQPVCWKIKAKA